MYLQTALEKNELEVRYRPTYNLKEGRFTRADSYMRIFIQGIGLVGAAEFMPIAEDSGQIRAKLATTPWTMPADALAN